MELKPGFKTNIQSYKHDEQVHRIWRHTQIVESKDNLLVTAHKKTRVYEQTGRSWYTKEPAVCYFYNDRWYNIIVMFKNDGLYYYCNISSPYLFDGEGLKYIDYDLDVKLFPDGTYIVLDRNEYEHNAVEMNYGEELRVILEKNLEFLINEIELKNPPFNAEYVKKHYLEAFGKHDK